ncbi:cupin domain-containing protein [Micromonospora sp. WMMD710]|uniref:cupin domain-containing protein n=1 Tax=Micromonospora sp. WMMD710 TaxID=3016085 RepID=UPI002416337B|nr:cupin domain-containing protein [Micromonospora sp. WMMD710]MDG4757313.1 cupin domain-containing protein [Micromonospora sp. WMMD710]
MESAPGLWRIGLQKHDLSIPGREVIQTRVEFTPDSPPFTHFHPGEEIICVLQGSLEYTLAGQPPVVCNAGDALTVPYGVHHQARNVGDGIAVELATYLVEKGKPLLTKVE